MNLLLLLFCGGVTGVWILHCHIGWHLAAGLAGMIVMQPSALRHQRLPFANEALCSGENQANINEIEPGRRRRSVLRALGYQNHDQS